VDGPLEGFEAKLGRADEHLRDLDDSVDRFIQSKPYRAVREPDPKGRDYILTGHIEKPLNVIEWSLLFGDCLFNLRSALDHLAWKLSGPNPPDKTEFPIFYESEDFERTTKGGGLYKIRGIKNGDARTIIESAQPCYRSHPKATALWALQALNIRDKHRFLNVSAAVVQGLAAYGDPPDWWHDLIDGLIEGPFEDDAEICRFPLPPGSPEPQVGVDFTITYGVALTESGPGNGWPLAGIARYIRETIRGDIQNPMRALFA
jgi:hypothetical protein